MKIALSDSIGFYMTSDGRDSIASRLYLYGPKLFESESLELFAQILELETINVVFDIGANTGVYSLLAASSSNSFVIHSFEPMPDIYSRLVANVETNSFKNVYTHDLALSEYAGEIDFHFMPAITVPTGGSIAKGDWPGVETVVVETLSLDEFFKLQDIQTVDLIKIDTETTEPSILRGGCYVIAKCRPTIICEVLDANSASEITALMKSMGYLFFHIKSDGLCEMDVIKHDPSYQYANYLLVYKEKIGEIKRFI